MTREQLVAQIKSKQSFLCVGLDTDMTRIPDHLLNEDDPVFSFNKEIIDHTKDFCIAYKPNIAFYESLGVKGWESLEKTIDYIPDTHFTIADAKRGDIGNTSKQYAKAFFETLGFDAITVAPYMGVDSVSPFLEYDNKWVILLALTSNKGSQDFQHFKNTEGEELFEKVLLESQKWGNADNLMYVVGATHPAAFEGIRRLAAENFLLVPGVGAQGGSVKEVCRHGMNNQVGLIINSSRGIIFAGEKEDFGMKAGQAAKKIQLDMSHELTSCTL